MDLGVRIKREVGSLNQKSAHYTRQSPFKGSNREVRGAILRALARGAGLTRGELQRVTAMPANRLRPALAGLVGEQIVYKKGLQYRV